MADLTLDDLVAGKPTQKRCRVAVVMDKLSENDRQVLEQAMAGSSADFSTNKITQALRERIGTIGHTTVEKHRSKTCLCVN